MDPAETLARPGTRAPHVPLEDGRSTLDLFGPGFVLVHGPDAAVPVGVAAHALPDAALERYGIAPAGAALVRPDGIVAWRSREAYSADAVTGALDRVLSREGSG
jgi:hypothetical protein